MKLLYATSIDIPSTRANRLQTMSMADAFHRVLGDNFLLGLRERKVGYLTDIPLTEIGKYTRSYALAWAYLRLAKERGFDRIYCREEKLLFFMVLYNQFFFRLPLTFCYEVHHLIHLQSWWHRYILRHLTRVVSVTAGMKEVLVASGFPTEETLVSPDAVNIDMFDIAIEKDEARRALGLPTDTHIILYTGTIHEPWKGVGVLYDAMSRLGEDYLGVIVGGKPHYVEYFNSLYPPVANMRLVGHRSHDEIPLYLKAADVLVLPNSGKEEISRIATSPMKLFEYMAAGRPIVASDLPSIREILNEHNALLVAPDDAEALAAGIRSIVEDGETSTILATQARRDVSVYTWENRAEKILSFVS
jgi:glycosyltransferase involved in cell wall biosynthesis